MSVNKLPSKNKEQVIVAKYPSRGFEAYEQRGGRPYVSQSAVENLVQWSNQATAIGTWNPGDERFFESYLNPTEQFTPMANMGINYLTVHIGSVANADTQIYPVLGTATATDFQIWGGYDYLRNNSELTNSAFTLYIRNAGTATYVLYGYNRWQYIQSNSGASSD